MIIWSDLSVREVAGGGLDVVAGHELVVAVAVLVDPPAELPEVVRLAHQVHLAAALKRKEKYFMLQSPGLCLLNSSSLLPLHLRQVNFAHRFTRDGHTGRLACLDRLLCLMLLLNQSARQRQRLAKLQKKIFSYSWQIG